MKRDALSINGSSLTVDDVFAVAVERRRVELSPRARKGMEKTRAVVEGVVARNEVVYGVTTGFGKLSDVAIAPEKLLKLQANLIRSHAAGVGDALPEPEVRAMMLLRANVLAIGFSGARPLLVDLLLGLLNNDLYPAIPEQGSVGASGDLAPLAHLGLALIGEGDIFVNHLRSRAADVLRGAGLDPVTLEPKEGIALINGTQAHTGVGVLALARARTLWHTAQV